MDNLSTLRRKLRAMQVLWAEVEPETDQEQKIRHAINAKLTFQIECEMQRQNVRVTFQMMSTHIITETYDNLEVEKVRTVFNWEAWRDQQIEYFNTRELNAIDFYTKQIQENGKQ